VSEGQSYHLRELSDAQYERSLRFPVQINADAISANYEHGVLTLSLPKAEEVKPRRINVQAVS
jgi:HSP20 family protein